MLHRNQGLPQTIDRIPERMRKLRVQQEKLEDLVRRDIRRIHLAVRFERRAASQQANPFLVLLPFRRYLRCMQDFRLIEVE